jgi:glycosyltransferase involved in cell wall biosynthesis
VAAVTTSVVLVVHNQPALTQACVESLQATRGPFELCIVDNASGEDTVDYLDRLARAVRLLYLLNYSHVGLIRALIPGAKRAHW